MVQNQSKSITASSRPLRRVLIVSKKTTYQLEVLERSDPHLLKLMAEGNPSVMALESTHREHLATSAAMAEALFRRGIEFKSIDRSQLEEEGGKYDLVMTLGGDGTFLETSHLVMDVPILGVNSATMSSHGHWCLANRGNFPQVLDDILSGTRLPLPIMRLAVAVSGTVLAEPIVNEVCICDPSPAGTTRFQLEVRGVVEELRSSGILIGPGSGSTGWMRSAGGVILPATSQQFQFLVREPCVWPGESRQLLRGLLERHESIKLVPIMPEAKVFIDGKHISYDIERGDEVIVRASPHDLRAYLSPEANEGYTAQ
jgi:NAD+ kinase